MSRIFVFVTVAAVGFCIAAGTANADRLILIPTGSTLGAAGIKAEYLASSEGGDAKAYWVNLGLSRFEVEGARFQDFGPDDVEAFGLQASVIPETSFSPAIALGIRDIADETEGKGVPYEGQSLYLAISKSVPVTGGIPLLLEDVKLHGGIGTGGLSGVFFGAEASIPMGLKLAAEYDTEDFNWAVSYGIIPSLRAKIASLKEDVYYGATFSISF